MQIHELNDFNGALGFDSFIVVDNGVDTGKLSTGELLSDLNEEVSTLDSDLNARIDNIIAGPAPSAEEVTDARIGADGVIYASLGNAIREQVGQLDNDLSYGTIVEKQFPNLADATSSLGTSWYCNDKAYNMNFVKKISVYAWSATTATALIVSIATKKVLFVGSASGSDQIDITVNQYIDEPFYVALRGASLAFLGCSYKETSVYYAFSSPYSYSDGNGANNYVVGDTFPYSFYTITPGTRTYIISVEVVSSTAQEEIKNNRLKLSDEDIVIRSPGYNNDRGKKLNNSFWVSDTEYQAGYVKAISVTNNSGASASAILAIIRVSDGTILEIYEGTGTDIFDINVEKYINYDFYVGIIAENFGYAKYENNDDYHWYNTNSSAIKLTGTQLNISWSGPGGQYVPNIAVKYPSEFGEIPNIQTNSNADETKRSNFVHNRMYVFGDSITAGHPYEAIDGIHWWESVGRGLGFNVVCGAYTGAGFVYVSGGYNGPVFADGEDYSYYDAVICALGTNDYGQNIPIGNENDMYDPDDPNNTVYGAINYVITHIMASNPAITLIFALPIDRRRVGSDVHLASCWNQPNSIGKTLNDYCDAIINRCNYYGLPYIDRHNSVINRCTMPTLLGDELHPTIEGYKKIGQEMSAKVGSILRPYIVD